MKKLFFISNGLCITHLLQCCTGRTNDQKFKTGTSMGRLRDLVVGRLGDQIMGRCKDVGHSCFLNSTHKHIKLTLTGYSRLYTGW